MRTEKDNTLVHEFNFENFNQAWSFLGQVAIIAEKHNHHPEIWNVYNKVILTLTTHDAGNTITEKDRVVAEEIENIDGYFH